MFSPGAYPADNYLQAGLAVYPQTYTPAPKPAAAPVAKAAVPAPKVRMQAPDPSRAPAVRIPSPEQLGLAPVASTKVDWQAIRGRLGQMKATCFQLDRVDAGGYRFTCWLPAEQAGKSYRVEGDGHDESEAVQACLERAERWARR